jgi:hypothetical protein
VRKYAPEVNYSATVFFVWLVISLSLFFFSCHYLPFLYLSLDFKALLIKNLGSMNMHNVASGNRSADGITGRKVLR